jgi:predicted nuclease with TOPRIM domain
MTWREKLAECGLTQETVSNGLRSKIKDFLTLEQGYSEVQNSIDNPDMNDDVDELESDLEDIQTAMDSANKQLIRAIEIYDKNKEKYAELSKNLGKGRPRKDAVKQEPTPNNVSSQQQTQQPTQQAANGVVVEKKKSSIGWLFFAGFAAVVTIGAVNLFKER